MFVLVTDYKYKYKYNYKYKYKYKFNPTKKMKYIKGMKDVL